MNINKYKEKLLKEKEKYDGMMWKRIYNNMWENFIV